MSVVFVCSVSVVCVCVSSRCNILISVKTIKEMPVSVASGTHSITHSVLSFVACPALKYCSTLSHNLHDFRKIVYGTQILCVGLIYNFVKSISHSKKNSARYDQNFLVVFI